MNRNSILTTLAIGFALAAVAASPALAQAPKIDREAFDKVKIGMSEKEVTDALGKPTLEDADDGSMIYASADFTKNITIFFKSGKVVQRIGTNLMDKDPITLTKANAQKIKEGMTVKEAVDIMGKSSMEADPDPKTGEGVMLWGSDINKKSLGVTFKSGKLTKVQSKGLDN